MFRESYSTEAEDLILQRLFEAVLSLGSATTGFYLDIGAYHPVIASNTHFFYRKGWRGVNVEPNPQFMPDFQRERPEDVTLNVGISDTAGNLEYHMFDFAVLNGFFGRDLVDQHIKSGHRYLGSKTVQCLATSDFLKSYVNRPIDFLNLDIETRERPVLSTWDWIHKRPKLICIEIHARTMADVVKSWQTEFLAEKGYMLMSRVWQSAVFIDGAILPQF